MVIKLIERGRGRQLRRIQLITNARAHTYSGGQIARIDSRSIGLARMADLSERQENNASVIVDAVPDPPGASDLELPLVEESPPPERIGVALERVLSLAPRARIRA
jgi:hypothetical protein